MRTCLLLALFGLLLSAGACGNSNCPGRECNGGCCPAGYCCGSNGMCYKGQCPSTGGGGGTTTAYCKPGYCWSYREEICCPKGSPYACKGACYSTSNSALTAGCTDHKYTCY